MWGMGTRNLIGKPNKYLSVNIYPITVMVYQSHEGDVTVTPLTLQLLNDKFLSWSKKNGRFIKKEENRLKWWINEDLRLQGYFGT